MCAYVLIVKTHSLGRFWPVSWAIILFWGPEVISMISMVVEPQGVLTCWSSTLTVLADSSPFHGLLLTVLGSESDYHD